MFSSLEGSFGFQVSVSGKIRTNLQIPEWNRLLNGLKDPRAQLRKFSMSVSFPLSGSCSCLETDAFLQLSVEPFIMTRRNC